MWSGHFIVNVKFDCRIPLLAAVALCLLPAVAAGQSAADGQITFTKHIAPILQTGNFR